MSGEPASSGARTVFAGRVFRVDVDDATLPNGERVEREVVRHPGAAAMVPLGDDGRVLLVRQWRHAAGRWLFEVPAGTLEGGESPEECALRELIEEVGRRAGELVPLGRIWPSPGYCDEVIWLYLARRLEPATQHLDRDEQLDVVPMSLERAVRRAWAGEIEDAKSVIALLRAQQWLEGAGPTRG